MTTFGLFVTTLKLEVVNTLCEVGESSCWVLGGF